VSQRQGVGKQLMDCVEQRLQGKGIRVLLVETSGLAEFELTRRFYPQCGYQQVAVIPDYYDRDDDKVVFWKALNP
jgi:ribosomal protein S18 acetylase RimI-like enzyme